jgi:hypothetical protein
MKPQRAFPQLTDGTLDGVPRGGLVLLDRMENFVALAFSLVVLALLYPLGRRWYRRRQASSQADALLSEVLKNKDAFRR